MTPRLARIRRGERAFERFYRRHVADVYRYALVLLRDPDDAEHVTQTTFLTAYRAFDRGERPRNSRAWLAALAHGACRERARAGSDYDDVPGVPEDRVSSPSEIRRALAHLPFDERAALVMRELESRSYAEIAHVLELSPAGVETLVFEARRALREQLEGALSCHEAERAISRQIDGRLARSERKPLRRHLRECAECAGFARSQRAQRSAWKVLGSVPLPASLKSFFGPGGVMATTIGKVAGAAAVGAVAKTLAVAAIGAGVVHESVDHETPSSATRGLAATAAETAAPAGRPTFEPGRPHAAASGESTSRPTGRAASPIAARPTHAQSAALVTKFPQAPSLPVPLPLRDMPKPP